MKTVALILGVTVYATGAMAQQRVVQGCIRSDSKSGYTLRDEHTGETYKLHGANAQVKQNVGHEVTAVGFAQKGTFEVKNVSSVSPTCTASSQAPIAATGKTGNEGEAMAVTSSASAGTTTPGVETQAGKAQRPGDQTNVAEGGAKPPVQASSAPGAPNPASAERIASSAERAEINNSQHQLGVNAQPNYKQNAQQQTTHTEKASRTGTAQQSESSPVLTGCLTSSGQGYVLKEQKSGVTHRLSASGESLKQHVNHLVEVTGTQTSGAGNSAAVAGGGSDTLQVTGVRDLAPTCSAHVGR